MIRVYIYNMEKRYIYPDKILDETSPIEVLTLFKERIRYNSITGELSNIHTNKSYTTIGHKEYINRIGIMYNHMRYTIVAHRLAWFLHYGDFVPKDIQLDHIDGNRSNNKISNLRKCTNQENQLNRKSIGEIPYKGVHRIPSRIERQYMARVTVAGVRITIGYFICPIIAAKYCDSAVRFYHNEFACPNFERISIKPMCIEDLRKLKIKYKH